MRYYIIDKSLLCYFFIIQLITALDFGYFNDFHTNYKCTLSLIKTAHIIARVLFSFIYIFRITWGHFYFAIIVLLTFSHISVCLALSLSKETMQFYNLQKELRSIDAKLLIDSEKYKINAKLLFGCIYLSTSRAIYSYLHCTSHPGDCFLSHGVLGHLILSSALNAIEIATMMTFFVYYSVYCRLEGLSVFMENGANNVREGLLVYKTLADYVDKYKKLFDILFVLVCTYRIPEAVSSTYKIMMEIKNTNIALISIVNGPHICYCIQNLILLFTPAFSGGLITRASHTLKLILHERLLQERDKDYVFMMKRFEEYVSARPLQLTVLQVVPLDWSLPFLVLNLCITYQIFIVQITHLF